MRPVFELRAECLVHQQACEPTAVYEQVARYGLAGFQHDLGDIAGPGLTYLGNPSLDPRNAVLFREFAQVAGITGGVDMVGVTAVVFGEAKRLRFRPEMLKPRRPAALARNAEGMDVVVADLSPVFELDG